MAKYQIIAATGCPTGIAHTYMAQEALEQTVDQRVRYQGNEGTRPINRQYFK